jgi:hypothetical protein
MVYIFCIFILKIVILIGNIKAYLVDSATILRDALNGKHLQEIRAAEKYL